jgi:hypothetical protein
MIAGPGARPSRGRLGVGGLGRRAGAAEGTLGPQGRGLTGALRHVAPFPLLRGGPTFRPTLKLSSYRRLADPTMRAFAAAVLLGGKPRRIRRIAAFRHLPAGHSV